MCGGGGDVGTCVMGCRNMCGGDMGVVLCVVGSRGVGT